MALGELHPHDQHDKKSRTFRQVWAMWSRWKAPRRAGMIERLFGEDKNVLPYVVALLGTVFVAATLLDAFEVVLLPRPVRHRARLNRYFFLGTWQIWSRLASRLPAGRRREDFIGVYGPLSMVLLFTLWAVCMIIGFGLLQWALREITADGPSRSFAREMIVSGDAFFTLGYGDIVPRTLAARLLVIVEAGTGFAFIAFTISYLPVLYQHFAQRDAQIIEFAARAGTPPSAAQLLGWHIARRQFQQLDQWLATWESWAGELIESHSTYPMLAFYRSQHGGHSWLASLAVVLDTCTLILAGTDDGRTLQAAATFAAARRVLNEVGSSLDVISLPWDGNRRVADQDIILLIDALKQSFDGWRNSPDTLGFVSDLRRAYEPQLASLSVYLMLPLPDWGTSSLLVAGPGQADLIHQLVRRSGTNKR